MAPPITARLPSDRGVVGAAVASAACLFVVLFIPLLTGRVFSMGDLSDFHLPLRYLYREALVEGQSILWTDKLFGGFYIQAEGQVGVLHPLHLMLYRSFPLTIAFNLEMIASYIFCFAGMHLLLRRYLLSSAAALVGGIAFTFSGFNLLHLLHMNAIAIVAHVPWLLLTLDGALLGGARRQQLSIVGMAALVASILLLGYPQYVWMAALICIIFVVVNARRASVSRLAIAGASAAAGVMLGGIQLLPTIDLLGQSRRVAMASDFSLTYSLHPLNLAQLFSPYILTNWVYAPREELYVHEFGIYNGAFCTIAGFWVLLRWRHLRHRGLAMFAGTLLAVGVVLALGRYGLIYEAIAGLPLARSFRAPARHIVLVHLALAVLAAVAFDDIVRQSSTPQPARPRPWIWLPLALSLGLPLVAAGWISTGTGFEGQTVNTAGAFIGAGLILVTTLLLTDAWRGSGLALMLLPALLTVDLALWGYGYVWRGGVATVAEIARQSPIPLADAGARLHAAQTRSPNPLLLQGFGIMQPYVGLAPIRSVPLESANALRVAGVEWFQRPDGWQRVQGRMPRVRIVPETLVSSDIARDISRVEVERVAILDAALPALDQHATAMALTNAPGATSIDVKAAGPALLATTETYHRGWRARGAGGSDLRTIRVYGDYLGVVLEPGQYRLSLTFAPRSFRVGVYLSIAGFLSVLALLVTVRRLPRADVG